MKRPLLCVLLLLLACSAWGWGYKLAIKSQGAGQICLVAESKMADIPSREVATYMAGESTLLYDNLEEYVVVIVVQADPDNMMQVEIWYLDAQGKPIDEIPERLILQGTAAAVRLRHPLARLLGRVL